MPQMPQASLPEPGSAPTAPKWTRRRVLKWALGGGLGLGLGGLGYTVLEAGWFRLAAQAVAVPRLPAPFAGLRAAYLSDLHHGPYTGLGYIKKAVAAANAAAPDVILLGGDYCHREAAFIRPCIDALGALRAPLGVFAVLGNHDHWEGAEETRVALRANGIAELTNCGVWLERGGARLRVAGVGDLWEDVQDLDAALGDAREADAALLLSHNPDFTEAIEDPRVSLVLSGHTHGGQVVLPFIGAPVVPSRYGQKYLSGLVQGPVAQVFVSRGLGTISPPLRFNCRPEINLLTLQPRA